MAASAFVEGLARSGAGGNTVAAFAADLRLFSRAVGGDKPVGDLTPDALRRFYVELQREGRGSGNSHSLRRRGTAVTALFRYLVDEGVLDDSMMVRVERPPEHATAEPPLSDEEVAGLLDAARHISVDGDTRPLLLISLVLSTGMSKGELLELRTDDLDLEGRTLTVRRGMNERVVPLGADVGQALQGYRARRAEGGRLFPWTGRNLEYLLAHAGERAGLTRNPSFRLLRATAAARMLDSGADAEQVAEALGISKHTLPALRRRVRPVQPSAPAES